jgi:hypothetical protein
MHKGAIRKRRLMLAKQIFGASDIWRHFERMTSSEIAPDDDGHHARGSARIIVP